MSSGSETSPGNTSNSPDLHPTNLKATTIATDPETNENQSICNIDSEMDTSTAIPTNSVNSQLDTNSKEDEDPPEEMLESLTSSATAFTISFGDDDDNKSIKRFGIRDSIRKFAPPKPDTIERPRPSKSEQNQEQQSLTSIQSASSNFKNHSTRYEVTNRSDQESNVSDSVAFLIDKMLNCEKKKSTITNGRKDSSGDVLLPGEIDYNEIGSDNGTYVVGADPETDAARHKIDELFGVVKAAEASVMANLNNSKQSLRGRSNDRKQHLMNRDRAERNHQSRSSSSSRQDNCHADRQRQPRTNSRHSNNTPSRQRRSISQSSHQSYQRDKSDNSGTRSSHSSLNQDTDTANLSLNSRHSEAPFASMKFNRTFDLRRARLGLGEPTSSRVNQQLESAESLNLSRNANQINSNTYKTPQQRSPASSCDFIGNFGRQDGGRYSLRTKNAALPNKLNSAHYHQNQILNRSPQQNITDQHRSQHYTPYARHYQSSKNSPLYQNDDELETSSSMSKYRNRIQQQQEPRKEVDGNESYQSFSMSPTMGNHESNLRNRPPRVQPGALDSLVISAISSLSIKIHQSTCGVLIEQAKRLPEGNETRLVVEEILPQLRASSSGPEPSSVEEIDQLLASELTKTLKNLKKVEQMVEVISQISNQLPYYTDTD